MRRRLILAGCLALAFGCHRPAPKPLPADTLSNQSRAYVAGLAQGFRSASARVKSREITLYNDAIGAVEADPVRKHARESLAVMLDGMARDTYDPATGRITRSDALAGLLARVADAIDPPKVEASR